MPGEINFAALQTPDYLDGALKAMQAGRAIRAQNALSGYQADAAGTVQNLIAAGDIQDAGALANLAYTQQQREFMGSLASRFLRGRGQGPQPQPVSTPQPQQPQQTQAPQVDPAQATARLQTVDAAASQLAGLPYEQRKTALTQMAPQLQGAGLSPDQLASFDPTDENLAAIHAQVQQIHAQLSAQPTAQPSAQPAPAAPPATAQSASAPAVAAPRVGADGSSLDLRNPENVDLLAATDIIAPQVGGPLTTLAQATTPKFESGRPGAPIIDPRTGAVVGYAADSQGNQVVPDGHGGWKVITLNGAAEAHARIAGATAGATTAAEESAKAPYDIVDVQMPDGTRQQMPLSDFRTLQKYGAAGKMGLGRSISPGDEQYQKDDAANFAKEVDAHGAAAAIGAQNGRTVTEQALHLAQGINPNAWTSARNQVAQAVNAATGGKIGTEAANNISTYTAILPQVLRGTFTTFPRIEKEFELIQKAAAGVNTPKDAASILLATQAAVQGKNLAYANFVQNWTGAKSKQAMTRAFLSSPQGQASIFADPIWRNLTIGGKPAVLVGNKPMADGHIYGVFRPGTPYAQTFLVQ